MEAADTATPAAAAAAKSEIVSQSEIESLLASIGGDQAAASGSNGAAAQNDPGSDSPHQLNFPQASSFSASELRKLRMRHEEFVRSLSGRLSSYLRLECILQMTKLETTSFQQFTENLSNPTHLTLLNLEPLRGICLMDVPPRLALCIVDRELGGPASSPDEVRELTNMESRLASPVIEIIASEWCGVWSDILDLRPALLRCENSGRFLRIHLPETVMLAVGIEVHIGKIVEQIRFALPCHTLKPIIAKINAENDSGMAVAAPNPPAPVKWNPALDNVRIRVSAELPGLEFTTKHIANLKPGDILPITSSLSDQIHVCLEGTPKFLGRLGTSGQHLAVQILKLI